MKYLLTAVALLLCLPSPAQYYRSPRPTYTPEPGGYLFMGANIRPMKNSTVDGVEMSINTRAIAMLHFGFYFCYAEGETNEFYGYNIKPGLGRLSTTTFGLDVSYLFPISNGTQAIAFSTTFCPELIKLGESVPGTSRRVNMHTFYASQKLARNAFYSIRPGIRFYSLQRFLMMGVHYNFLTGNPIFGTTTDFEGFQYILAFRLWSDKKRDHYFY